jgi:hypothetical protein
MSGIIGKSFQPSHEMPFFQNPLSSAVMGLGAALLAAILCMVFVVSRGKRNLRKVQNALYMKGQGQDFVETPYSDANMVAVEKS